MSLKAQTVASMWPVKQDRVDIQPAQTVAEESEATGQSYCMEGGIKMAIGLPLLQVDPAPAAGGQLITMLVTFGLIIVIFYMLVIRPQNKKQKDTQKMLGAVKKGDRVTTIGGIRGLVTAVKEQTLTLKVDDNTKIEFTKSAISSVLDKKEAPTQNAE